MAHRVPGSSWWPDLLELAIQWRTQEFSMGGA